MEINGFNVSFSVVNGEVWIAFDQYLGTLEEILLFRNSFDYECYRFGNGFFNYAKWKTITADDHHHQKYPQEIGLCNNDHEITISWLKFEQLLQEAQRYLQSQHLNH